MKNRYSNSVFAAAAALCAASAVWAAPGRSITFHAPFAFTAGVSKLPAGDYALAEDDVQHVVYLTNEHNGKTVMMLPEAILAAADAAGPSVRFVKSGDEYNMKAVRMEGTEAFHLP
jgi:hypothetical protein